MNVVLDDAVEIIQMKEKEERKQDLGQILLKGDNIALLTAAPR